MSCFHIDKKFKKKFMEKNQVSINISLTSIVKVAAAALILFFLYLISDILYLVFLSFFLTTLIEPLVDFFQEKRIPRTLSMFIIYFFLIVLIAALVWLIAPPIALQVNQLIANFPDLWNQFSNNFSDLNNLAERLGIYQASNLNLSSLELPLTKAASGFYAFVSTFFKNLLDIIFVLVLTFYLILEKDSINKVFRAIVPIKYLPRAIKVYAEIKDKVGDWARGQLILGFIIGLMVFSGLIFLVPKYALILAIIAGVLELVPYFGPILSAIPAIFLGLMVPDFSVTRALAVLIMFIVIQELENNLLVPQVMKKKVGISPVVTIIAMLIGIKIFGIIGIILAVPVATALSIILKEFGRKKTSAEKTE